MYDYKGKIGLVKILQDSGIEMDLPELLRDLVLNHSAFDRTDSQVLPAAIHEAADEIERLREFERMYNELTK